MSTTYLQLTPRDPIIARDGRPFGVGQGNRMRGLGWPSPSVVAGAFRTALVKAHPNLDFTGDMPQWLMATEVAGMFPTMGSELYLPAPSDAVAEPTEDGKAVKQVHRVTLQPNIGGCDFPDDLPLRPVMLSEDQAGTDFKPKPVPAWWPLSKFEEWLTLADTKRPSDWFSEGFLNAPIQETHDHVCLDADTGAAAEGQIFATAGLNVTYLPRYGVVESKLLQARFAEISLSARVTTVEEAFKHVKSLDAWHPLGGERRLVHWQQSDAARLWTCPETVKAALESATQIRMVLTTPAIFDHGWRPNWLDAKTLMGKPISDGPTLRLVGVSNIRWKAVSGWSLAPPRGPKPIRRMVPAGSVYFFEKVEGQGSALATNGWLRPVSDVPQDRNDGFGLAVWGTW